MSSNISLLSTNPLELDVKLSERPPQLVVRHLAQGLCEVAVRLGLDRSPADRRHRRGVSESVGILWFIWETLHYLSNQRVLSCL